MSNMIVKYEYVICDD